jgi:hypothetical protein
MPSGGGGRDVTVRYGQQQPPTAEPTAITTTGVNCKDLRLLSARAAPFSCRSSSRATFGGGEGAGSPLAAPQAALRHAVEHGE